MMRGQSDGDSDDDDCNGDDDQNGYDIDKKTKDNDMYV